MMLKKIISILFIIMIVFFYTSNVTYAIDKVVSDAESFIASRETEEGPLNEKSIIDTSDYVYNILFTIAVVIAFAIGIIIGIQFILGSAEEQAKVKETLIPYVIGVFVVFASFTIWKIVITIGNDVSPTPGSRIVAEQQKETEQKKKELQEIKQNYNEIINTSDADIRTMNSMRLQEFKTETNKVLKDLANAKENGILTQTEWSQMSEKVTEKLQTVTLTEAGIP